jgi:hypothetical protein
MENGIRQRWGLIDPAAEAQPSRLQLRWFGVDCEPLGRRRL